MNDFSDKSNIYVKDGGGQRILLFERLSQEEVSLILSLVNEKDRVEVRSVYAQSESSIPQNHNVDIPREEELKHADEHSKNADQPGEAIIYENGQVVFYSSNDTSNLPSEYYPDDFEVEPQWMRGNSDKKTGHSGSYRHIDKSSNGGQGSGLPKSARIIISIFVGIPAILIFFKIFSSILFPAIAELIYYAIGGGAMVVAILYLLTWISSSARDR